MKTASHIRGAVIFLALLVGCEPSTGPSNSADYVDESITRFQSLGWLGARTQPLNETLTLMVDEERRSVGGVVIRELIEDGTLARHGAKLGDIIVRVGDEWIVVTNDMDLLVLEHVERAISSRAKSVELGCWRAGVVVAVDIPVDRVALEVGLPIEVERFEDASRLAVTRLRELQQPNGGYAVASSEYELAIDAMVGLAFLSTGARPGGDNASAALKKLDTRIRDLLKDESKNAAGLVYAVMYLCEFVGPLPPEVLVAASESGASGAAPTMGGTSFGVPSGAHGFDASSMKDLQEMMKKMGGKMEMTFEVGPSGKPPSGQPPFAGGTVSGAKPAAAIGPVNGPGIGLDALLAEHAPDRVAANAAVAPSIAALVDLQDESGLWGASDESSFERFLLTCHALVALGMAQRIGLDVPEQAIQRGIEAVRPLVDDGKLAARVARGADRREEAGRAAHAAWALLSLGVGERDEFRELLLSFSDSAGREVLTAPRGVAFHVWATAATRRARGLSEWQRYYDDFRVWLVARQEPSGGFVPTSPEPTSLEKLGGEALATAIGTQLLAFQTEATPVLLTRAGNPLVPQIDGHGKRTSTTPAPEPDEGTSTTITDPKEAAKLLESLGVEIPAELQDAGGEGGDTPDH